VSGQTQRVAEECVVLIVDDDPDISETIAFLLDERGYRSERAANGKEALERLRRLPRPQLILLDLSMPVMDGREFRRRQLAAPELASIPVVVVTAASATANDHARMQTPGWLIKPIALDTLLHTVERYCLRPAQGERGTTTWR
jgi:CheY-like chemotaxis protein